MACVRLRAWDRNGHVFLHLPIPFILRNDCVRIDEYNSNRARNMFNAQMRIPIQVRSPLRHVFAWVLKLLSSHATTCKTKIKYVHWKRSLSVRIYMAARNSLSMARANEMIAICTITRLHITDDFAVSLRCVNGEVSGCIRMSPGPHGTHVTEYRT